MTAPRILITLHLFRHLHFIFKSKYKNLVDQAITGKALCFVLDLWYPDRKPDGFPTPNSHGLVGNVDWGESLTVVACEFLGLNNSQWD